MLVKVHEFEALPSYSSNTCCVAEKLIPTKEARA